MKLQRINLEQAAKADLTDEDRFVLNVIYQSRMRTFLFVFGAIALFVIFRAAPYFLSDDASTQFASIAALLLIVILPALFTFTRYIWIYKKDAKAGFKYIVYEQVTGKQHFPLTGQYFLSLTDVDYMHHEVEQDVYESVRVGDRYPVYFAAFSRYPFTLRSRITMM